METLHLVIDGYGADESILRNVDLIYRFLDEYPDSIDMTKITSPQVYTYHGQTKEDWGISGFVLIAESHISIHTFPDRGYLNVDIFSCKDFDAESSLNDVKRFFSLSDTKMWQLDRGIDYSRPIQAYGGMVSERMKINHKSTD